MREFILILAAIGISFLLSRKEGPFNIILKIREKLQENKYIGVFSFKLINCPFCLSFWVGLVLHFLFYGISFFAIPFAFSCAILAIYFSNNYI